MAIINFKLKKHRQEGDMEHTYAPLRNLLTSDNSIVDFNTNELSVSLSHPLSIDCQPSYDGTVNLIINDDINPPRLVNTRFSRIENNRYRIITRNQLQQTNLYQETKIDQQTRLLRNINKIPTFDLFRIDSYGQLMGGNYTFYLKYCDEDGNQTAIAAESGIVSIFHGNYTNVKSISGTLVDERTNKSIVLNVNNLDTTFSSIKIYYTREYCDQNGIRLTEAKQIVKPIPVKAEKQSLNITGYENTLPVTIDELNLTYHSVTSVKTQTQVQNRLFFGNIQESKLDVAELQNLSYFIEVSIKQQNESIGYINHEYKPRVADNLTQVEYYSPNHIYYNLGYWPDEMYRLGIVYILNDDSLTPVFNLRGCVFDKLDDNNLRSDTIPNTLYVSPETSEKNYLERDVLLENGLHLDNTFGVFKNPKCSVIQSEGVYPLYYEFTIKEEILKELYTHRVKGYFIVRQKRIPTIITQGLSIGIDTSSYIPMLNVGTDENKRYIAEGFLNSGKILSESFEDRILETDFSAASALISVDTNVTPMLQSMLDGSEFLLEPVYKGVLESTNRHYYHNIDAMDESNNISSPVIFVPEDTSLKYIDNKGFSTRAGYASDVKSFGFFKSKQYSPKKGIPVNYVRGVYCPIIGVTKKLQDNRIYNIRIKEYSKGYLKEYFKIRGEDNSPFYSVSNRFELGEQTNKFNVYRGDCYTNTVTVRLNRNFSDPDVPIQDLIINEKTWKDNYNGYLTTSAENWGKINRADTNAVPLGTWVTYKCLSSYNLGIRAINRNYPDEQALLGNPRSFYPVQNMSTNSGFKVSESWLLNDGYNSTVSQLSNSVVQNVPYINDLFDNRIMFSNMQTECAFKNAYRIFTGLSYGDVDRQYGAIVKLLPWYTDLFCVFEHGLAIVPINEKALIQTTTGQSVHMYGAGVIQNQISLISPDFGSIWQESILETPIGIYGVDTYAKKIWKFSKQNGLEIISDMRIQRFLNDNISLKEEDKYPLISLLNVKTHYNNEKGDVMFTFYDYKNGKEWNLCFNERLNKWITRYSWTPLYSENINNTFYSLDKKRGEILTYIYNNKQNSYGLLVENNQWTGRYYDNDFVIHPEFTTTVKYVTDTLASDFKMSVNKITSSYLDENKKECVIDIPTHLLHLKKSVNEYEITFVKSELEDCCGILPLYFKIDVVIEPMIKNAITNIKYNKTIGIIVDNRYDELQFNELLCNGFYVHGRSGIIDEIDYTDDNPDNQIKPTYWYNKQEPFEFEFVVSQPAGLHKIFENLIIISNNVKPEEIEFEIIGDVYTFVKEWKQTLKNNQNFDLSKFQSVTVKYDPILNQRSLLIKQQCRDMEVEGRRAGNIHYKEDAWYTTIEPIIYDNKSARIRDKFIKIRVKYSGEDQVLISSLHTLFNLSYS